MAKTIPQGGPLHGGQITIDDYGPTCVRQFVAETQILGERTAEQWQVDLVRWTHGCALLASGIDRFQSAPGAEIRLHIIFAFTGRISYTN
jgi:hypothetical protein